MKRAVTVDGAKKAAAAAPAKRASPRPQKPAAAAARPDGSKPYHHGNLPDEFVRFGKLRLKSEGLSNLSLRRIAADAGVSQVAPKHHFGNKEGLLAAIAASGFRDLTEFRLSRIKPEMTAEERLRSLLASYVAFATLNPALFRLMFAPEFKTPEVHSELNEVASQSYKLMAGAASDYLAGLSPKRAASGITGDDLARMAWICMHGLATLMIQNRINPVGAPKYSREQLTNRTLDLVFAGFHSATA